MQVNTDLFIEIDEIPNRVLNKNISINELTKACNGGRETIKRNLNKLEIMNLIQHIGPDKTGYWQILQNN